MDVVEELLDSRTQQLLVQKQAPRFRSTRKSKQALMSKREIDENEAVAG